MGALAVVYLATSFLVEDGRGPSDLLIGGLALVFGAEFTARCLDAPSRRAYFRSHWLDFISCIPLIGGLRSLRILRLLRLGAAMRILSLSDHAAGDRNRSRESLWFLGPVLITAWFVASAAYWTIERGANHGVHSFVDALYWTFITATTVGYGDVTPVTPGGRILAGFVIFFGIGFVGFASARLTQRWLKNEDHTPQLLLEKFESFEREIAHLKQLLSSRHVSRTSFDGPTRRVSHRRVPPSSALADSGLATERFSYLNPKRSKGTVSA